MDTNTQLPQEFNSLMELIAYFTDETKCLQYLQVQRWGAEIYCPHCGSEGAYRFSDGKRFKCASCREQFTAKVGTIFEGSKIPMVKWFVAIYLHTSHKKGISSHQLAKDIKVTQKSAWFMLHRIRFALNQGSFDAPLGGGGGIVEADETWIGGKVKNKHASKKIAGTQSGYGKTAVMGIVERSGQIRTFVLPDTEKDTMQNALTANIAPDATLITDSHNSYKTYYKTHPLHVLVKSKEGSYVTDKHFHTNNIEGYWSLLKRSIIGIYHYVSPKHLQAYCDEMAFRYNTREMNEGNRVTLTLTKTNKRLTYNSLIGKSHE